MIAEALDGCNTLVEDTWEQRSGLFTERACIQFMGFMVE